MFPRKVLITGGHEVGGLTSFAEALSEGFRQLGVPCEIIAPTHVWHRQRELRDPDVLKILSSTAMFASPFARRAICVAHGFPTAGVIGWGKFLGHVAADHLANHLPNVRLVAVSEYSAVHLHAILAVRVDRIIPNPLRQIFLDSSNAPVEERPFITYAGRLHPSKNLHLLLPPILDVLNSFHGLRACIIGDGPERARLERIATLHPRVEFRGTLDALQLREQLRATKVFISGCATEALGIAYLEALSQGCNVVMPAGGGGLEIAPDLIGSQIQLMPLGLDRPPVAAAIRRALHVNGTPMNVESFASIAIASEYIEVGGWFSNRDLLPSVQAPPLAPEPEPVLK